MHLTISWQYRDNTVTISWQYRDNIVTILWQYLDNTVTIPWQYRDNIVTVRVQVNAPYNIVKLLIGSQRNGLMLPNLQLLTAGLKSGILIEVVGTTYIRCVYIIFGRKITRYTVMYCVYIRFWPNLVVQQQLYRRCTPLVDVISNRTAKALFKLAIA
jgi:hypothetical protein